MSGDALLSYLSVLQLADSAFPSGRYTLSYGLEAVAQDGHLGTRGRRTALTRLLADAVRFGVGPSDGAAIACVHRAVDSHGRVDWDAIFRVENRLTAIKLPAEARYASTRTGRALLLTASAMLDEPVVADYAHRADTGRAEGHHATAFGLITAVLGVPMLSAVAGELYAFSSGLVSASVRLGLADHRAAQHILHRARPVIAAAAREAAGRTVAQISSSTPFLDVMSMRHEQAELRLFAS
ncbi:MAG TPA: urease accessory UreF family protein [Jatrophihabitans sp.]|nr:urease accessory UreF family protein [Jatrophihabitans sp.]